MEKYDHLQKTRASFPNQGDGGSADDPPAFRLHGEGLIVPFHLGLCCCGVAFPAEPPQIFRDPLMKPDAVRLSGRHDESRRTTGDLLARRSDHPVRRRTFIEHAINFDSIAARIFGRPHVGGLSVSGRPARPR